MSWVYQSISGRLYSPDGQFYTTCYSGHGEGLNNTALEQVHNVGPLPRGMYRIGTAFDSADHGKHCMHLTPEPGTDTFGRDGLLCHGDEVEHPGEHLASHGCLVAPKYARERMTDSGDNKLQVI